jgi:hypothetical protein
MGFLPRPFAGDVAGPATPSQSRSSLRETIAPGLQNETRMQRAADQAGSFASRASNALTVVKVAEPSLDTVCAAIGRP